MPPGLIPVTEPFSPATGSIRISGGRGAPELARRHVLSWLDDTCSGVRSFDAALIATELVTNSVLHAGVGVEQSLFLELTTFADHVRIAVVDPGSELEPLLPRGPAASSGFGLRLVDELSSAWGVARDASGMTRVWCDLCRDPNASAS